MRQAVLIVLLTAFTPSEVASFSLYQLPSSIPPLYRQSSKRSRSFAGPLIQRGVKAGQNWDEFGPGARFPTDTPSTSAAEDYINALTAARQKQGGAARPPPTEEERQAAMAAALERQSRLTGVKSASEVQERLLPTEEGAGAAGGSRLAHILGLRKATQPPARSEDEAPELRPGDSGASRFAGLLDGRFKPEPPPPKSAFTSPASPRQPIQATEDEDAVVKVTSIDPDAEWDDLPLPGYSGDDDVPSLTPQAAVPIKQASSGASAGGGGGMSRMDVMMERAEAQKNMRPAETGADEAPAGPGGMTKKERDAVMRETIKRQQNLMAKARGVDLDTLDDPSMEVRERLKVRMTIEAKSGTVLPSTSAADDYIDQLDAANRKRNAELKARKENPYKDAKANAPSRSAQVYMKKLKNIDISDEVEFPESKLAPEDEAELRYIAKMLNPPKEAPAKRQLTYAERLAEAKAAKAGNKPAPAPVAMTQPSPVSAQKSTSSVVDSKKVISSADVTSSSSSVVGQQEGTGTSYAAQLQALIDQQKKKQAATASSSSPTSDNSKKVDTPVKAQASARPSTPQTIPSQQTSKQQVPVEAGSIEEAAASVLSQLNALVQRGTIEDGAKLRQELLALRSQLESETYSDGKRSAPTRPAPVVNIQYKQKQQEEIDEEDDSMPHNMQSRYVPETSRVRHAGSSVLSLNVANEELPVLKKLLTALLSEVDEAMAGLENVSMPKTEPKKLPAPSSQSATTTTPAPAPRAFGEVESKWVQADTSQELRSIGTKTLGLLTKHRGGKGWGKGRLQGSESESLVQILEKLVQILEDESV